MRITPSSVSQLASLTGRFYIDTDVWIGHGARRLQSSSTPGAPASEQLAKVRGIFLSHLDGQTVIGVTSDLVELEFGGAMACVISRGHAAVASPSDVSRAIDGLRRAWDALGIETTEVDSIAAAEFGSVKALFNSAAQISRESVVQVGGSAVSPKFGHLGLVDAIHVKLAEAVGADFIVAQDKAFEGLKTGTVQPVILSGG